MQGKVNAHKLFRGNSNDGFCHALNISDAKDQALIAARDLIRDTLREGLPKWQRENAKKIVTARGYADHVDDLPIIRPRFRMQGSMVYKTLNDPAHSPPQQIDVDDGVYFPTRFLTGNGSLEPAIAAQVYFLAVEDVLEPFVTKRGWSLVPKSTCIRIVISNDAHIDLPLYAVPEHEFTALTKAVGTSFQTLFEGERNVDTLFAEHVYDHLPDDQIMLAYRENQRAGWKASDPREIERWFRDAVDAYGNGLRYICRYLKAWRDYQWSAEKCSLSSLSLMAAVVHIYDEFGGELPKERDDVALFYVTQKLPAVLNSNIPNPVLSNDPDLNLDSGWEYSERQDFISRATDLHAHLQSALTQNFDRSRVIDLMREVFGDRIPYNTSLIEIDTEEQKIKRYEPARVAAPFVPRTTSG